MRDRVWVPLAVLGILSGYAAYWNHLAAPVTEPDVHIARTLLFGGLGLILLVLATILKGERK